MSERDYTSQNGPRNYESVLAGRYWLTDKGEAVVEQIRSGDANES